MSDEQPKHPLNDAPPPRSPHPLRDLPPEAPQGKTPPNNRIKVVFPGTVRVPMATYVLLVINIVLFALRFLAPDFAIAMIRWGVADPNLILNHRELYRLFTAMFLHFNEAHILFNGIALYYIGTNIERIFGHARFLIVYLLGGIAGSVLMVLFGSGGLGASGAVFAIWGAEAIFLYQHRILFGAPAIERLRQSLILMVMNFVMGFVVNLSGGMVGGDSVRISNVAHFGGLLGGAILTWLIGPRFMPQLLSQSQEAKVPVVIIQTNQLSHRIRDILFYCIGLVFLLLLAVILQS